MNEDAGFLAKILSEPDDDTHRLVYADWLEEHGGEPGRAEFIRVQVELARMPQPPRVVDAVEYGDFRPPGDGHGPNRPHEFWCAAPAARGLSDGVVVDLRVTRDGENLLLRGFLIRDGVLDISREPPGIYRFRGDYLTSDPYAGHRQKRQELLAREQELLDGHAHEWLFSLPPGLRPSLPDDIRRAFRRGFVESATCTAAEWFRDAGVILAANPVRRVVLTTLPVVEAHRRGWTPHGYELVRFGLRGDPAGEAGTFTFEEVASEARAQYPGASFDWGRAAVLLSRRWDGIAFTLPPG